MENITIKNYQKHAMETCLPSAKNWEYAYYGFESEQYELYAKIWGGKAKAIRDGNNFNKIKSRTAISDELGDCYWFVALMCELTDCDFTDVVSFEFSSLRMAWKFARQQFGLIKSLFYAWELSKSIFELNKEVRRLGELRCDILQRNIDKLASRAERGVLKGSGDNR